MHDLIGEAGAPSFDDPLGMLVACHGRIERQKIGPFVHGEISAWAQ